MRTLAYYVIPDRRLASSVTGTEFKFPVLAAGQWLEMAFRFLDRINGELVEVSPYVRNAKLAIGNIDERPDTGLWGLKIAAGARSEANSAGGLGWDISQKELETRLNALSGKPDDIRVRQVVGGWVLRREDGGQLALSVVENTLGPVSFADIEGWQEEGVWYYEIRHKQAPLAFTSTSSRVDPGQPRIEPMQDGGNNGSGGSFWNELQKIIVPVDFRGGYIVRNPDALSRTNRLDNTDTQESLTEALTALMGDTVQVSDSEVPGVAFIEFSGENIEGSDQPLLEVEVVDAPRGDVTLRLPLFQPALRAAMRSAKVLKDLPVELTFEFVDSQEAESDPESAGTISKSAGLKATINRELDWASLEEVAGPDWVLTPTDRLLMRWSADQVAQGVQHYVRAVGNGSAISIALTHNLATEEIAHVLIFDQGTKEVLEHGTDYTFQITSANVVTITFAVVPLLNQFRVVITAAVPIEAFAGHTHDTVQINRAGVPLNDILDDIGENLSVLNGVIASTGPAANATQASGMTILLPDTQEVLFFDGDAGGVFNATARSKVARGVVAADAVELFDERRVLNAAALALPAPYMLPACHDATVVDVTALPTAAGTAGSVWKNNGSVDLVLPGGGMLIGAPRRIVPGGFLASDGRLLFAATRSGETNSYYPTAFERELWRIHINDKMLALNRTLDVQFGLGLQLVGASSNAQWVLVIERGTTPADTSPATTGQNLQNVVWEATPILSQRIILSNLLETHSFGARIKRRLTSGVDTLTMDTMLYGVWGGANSLAPASANFALRARLINLDTENARSADARGWITYQIISPVGLDSDTGEQNTARAKATII